MFSSFEGSVGAFLRRHVAPFFDPAALVMWAVSVGLLLMIDPVMVKTLIQWALFFFTLAGIVVVVSRLAFPMINLREQVEDVYNRGNVGAAVVVLAVALFMGLTLLAAVLWAKA